MNKQISMSKIILNFIRILLCIIFMIPLYYALVNSFGSIYQSPSFFFKSFHPENYVYAVTLIPFWQYLKNSVIIVVLTVTMGLVFNFIYGYCFARLKARGKDLLFTITLSMMMIPGFAVSIPRYIFLDMLGIRDTWFIYILFGLPGSAATIFVFRQYLLTFPKEIEESAIVDGANYFSILWYFYVPMCKGILMVQLFGMFLGAWGDYMTPFMFFSKDKYPLAIALFNADYSLPNNPQIKLTNVTLAAAILFMLPNIIVFFLCQKQLVDGVIEGSVKG